MKEVADSDLQMCRTIIVEKAGMLTHKEANSDAEEKALQQELLNLQALLERLPEPG
jgi:hypothetical protein